MWLGISDANNHKLSLLGVMPHPDFVCPSKPRDRQFLTVFNRNPEPDVRWHRPPRGDGRFRLLPQSSGVCCARHVCRVRQPIRKVPVRWTPCHCGARKRCRAKLHWLRRRLLPPNSSSLSPTFSPKFHTTTFSTDDKDCDNTTTAQLYYFEVGA